MVLLHLCLLRIHRPCSVNVSYINLSTSKLTNNTRSSFSFGNPLLIFPSLVIEIGSRLQNYGTSLSTVNTVFIFTASKKIIAMEAFSENKRNRHTRINCYEYTSKEACGSFDRLLF